MCEGVFFVVVLELSCKLRTFDVRSSGNRVDLCFKQMLVDMSLTPLHIVPDSSDIGYVCFPPGGVAVGQAEITAAW